MQNRNILIKKLIYLSSYRGKSENEKLLENMKPLLNSSTYSELELFSNFLHEHDDDIFRWLTIPNTVLPKYVSIINKLAKFK